MKVISILLALLTIFSGKLALSNEYEAYFEIISVSKKQVEIRFVFKNESNKHLCFGLNQKTFPRLRRKSDGMLPIDRRLGESEWEFGHLSEADELELRKHYEEIEVLPKSSYEHHSIIKSANLFLSQKAEDGRRLSIYDEFVARMIFKPVNCKNPFAKIFKPRIGAMDLVVSEGFVFSD